jgi:hypothetical protein
MDIGTQWKESFSMNIRRYMKKKPTLDRTRGRLENLAFVDVVQIMTMSGKTGCIILKNDDTRGEAWFENGRLRHAGSKGVAGEDAFCSMMAWESGEFEILHGALANMPSMDCDPMHLLMLGARRLDESVWESSVKPVKEPARVPGAWRRPEVIAPVVLAGLAGLITLLIVF